MNNLDRFGAVESKVWVHKVTGRKVSPHGALPYVTELESREWELLTDGWTVYDAKFNTYGVGRPAWKTKAEAQTWIDKEISRLEECRPHGSFPPGR